MHGVGMVFEQSGPLGAALQLTVVQLLAEPAEAVRLGDERIYRRRANGYHEKSRSTPIQIYQGLLTLFLCKV